MSVFFSNKENKTVNELIIEILANDFPLTTKALHSRILKFYAKQVSYQAVFKSLKLLLNNGIVKREGKYYLLSIEWINNAKNFFSQLEEQYKDFNKKDIVAEALFAGLV